MLANYIEIPPPTFHGKMVYREHGTEKWTIKTTIPGLPNDPNDQDMEYTQEYPDWYTSVEVAMQGAIARICHKYRFCIARTSPYYLFGGRTEDGTPVDRNGSEYISTIHSYLMEREIGSVSLENLLRHQITLMDDFRTTLQHCNQRIRLTETTILALGDRKDALEERIKILEEPRKLEEKLIESDVWNGLLNKLLKDMIHNREVEWNEKNQLKRENEELKRKIAELKAAQKGEEPEEEDPEEPPYESSRDEESNEKYAPPPKKARKPMKSTDYTKLFKPY